jgi:hypothetical protein
MTSPCMVLCGEDVPLRSNCTWRDTLGQESVTSQLCQLRRPEIASDDLVVVNPVRIYALKQVHCFVAARCFTTTDQDAIRFLQVEDSSTLNGNFYLFGSTTIYGKWIVTSARNSGFDTISNWIVWSILLLSKTVRMRSAVQTGTVMYKINTR